MVSKGIISADSHVSEPGDLWIERIDREYQFRAPRLEQRVRDGKVQDFFIYEGWPPHSVGVGLGAAAQRGESFREEGKGYADALPGGWDPEARLQDQDTDGVVAEVLYTTLGFRLYWMRDPGLMSACFRAYNDWLSDFCSEAPDRLYGLALISLGDIPAACQELRRARSLGHKGAMIPLSPAQGSFPYASHAYDEFWATAQELDIALVLHENTGGAESQLSQSSYWNPESSIQRIVKPHEVQRSIAQLVISGVFERFPALRVVSAENGTDWLPWFINRMGQIKQKTNYETPLTMLPIEYFRRNVFFTYIDEPWAVENLEIIGEDNLMFSTDYPHTASTWPKSQEVVERDCADLPEGTRDKLVHDNVLAVFR
ncbi:MAG: amidohydrolase [Acidimicrobiaceae bacterium]|nr:amidohydrolase [Acidimicrobiaceae bacterium]